MDKNTYTDIYNGFVERENTENRNKPQTVLQTKKVETKKALKSQTETYTDIYGGYVEREEEITK